MKYTVYGIMKLRGGARKFAREITAHNERLARERCVTDLGSRHRITRNRISIEKVEKGSKPKKSVR